MTRVVDLLNRIVETIALLLGYLAAASAALLSLVVTYGVMARFVFNKPQIWTDQIASYSLLWIVFFGLAYTLSTGSHIRVDFFTQLLSPRTQYRLEIMVTAIGCLFSVLLFLGCLSIVENFARRNTHSTIGLIMPLYWPALPMVVGAGLFGVVMFIRFFHVCATGRIPPAGGGAGT